MTGRLYPYGLQNWGRLFLQAFMDDINFEAQQEVMKTASHYCKRKGWESSYDPKYQQKNVVEVTKVPDVSTLPVNRWVIPRKADEDESQRDFRRSMLAWLTEQKCKYQVCIVTEKHREKEVFLFKKASDALLFKLTWG